LICGAGIFSEHIFQVRMPRHLSDHPGQTCTQWQQRFLSFDDPACGLAIARIWQFVNLIILVINFKKGTACFSLFSNECLKE
jgi:hypothetical protein